MFPIFCCRSQMCSINGLEPDRTSHPPVFERPILPLICNFCSPRKWLGEKSLKVVNVEMIYQTEAKTRIWKVAITKPEVDHRCENCRCKQSEAWYKYGWMKHSWMSRQTLTSRTNTSQNNNNGFKRVIQESESALHLSWNVVTWQLSGKQISNFTTVGCTTTSAHLPVCCCCSLSCWSPRSLQEILISILSIYSSSCVSCLLSCSCVVLLVKKTNCPSGTNKAELMFYSCWQKMLLENHRRYLS